MQSRVPLLASCASGTTHLMSSTFGHGQSTGLCTHMRVSWQRYSEQETVIERRKPRGDQLMEDSDAGDSGCLLLSACMAHCWLPDGCCCCCGCPNIPLKNWNCALASAKRENARIKTESLDDNDMAVAVVNRNAAARWTVPWQRRLGSRDYGLISCVAPHASM